VCSDSYDGTDNVVMPAADAKRRPCSSRSISPTRLTLRAHAGTDRLSDTVPLPRPCSAYYAGSANKMRRTGQKGTDVSDVCLKHTQTRRVRLHKAAAAAVPYCIINTDCSKFKTHHSQPLCGHYTRVSFYILVKSMDNFIGSQLHCP